MLKKTTAHLGDTVYLILSAPHHLLNADIKGFVLNLPRGHDRGRGDGPAP
ncbi:MAG: hypothetical protein SWQ30_19760 [Thermodesulfobacteriota bacterium]|nr:hypothetical protein [Thermodesulfobacteriota bacterium]